MVLKKLIQEKIWIIGVLLLICGIVTLNRIYFITDAAQNLYYFVYNVLAIITIYLIRKYYSFKIHHVFFIFINVLVIFIALYNHFIALPLLLIFPLFCSGKSHWIYKVFSTISYVVLILIVLSILFIRQVFTSTTLINTINSPNNKQMIEVYSFNKGALGGATYIYLADKYFNTFKKSKIIHSGRYGTGNDIKWIDTNNVQVDDKIINISSE